MIQYRVMSDDVTTIVWTLGDTNAGTLGKYSVRGRCYVVY